MTPRLNDYRGLALPDLKDLGLARKMPEAARLVDEHVRHVEHRDGLGFERMDLEQEIRDLEHSRTQAWGEALRSGAEPPSEEAIQAKKVRLEEVLKEAAAVEHAAMLSYEELLKTVAEHAPEWDPEVQAKGEKILREAQQMAVKLADKLAEVEPLIGVHGWLGSGGMGYGSVTPAQVSIDNIIRERERELGLLEQEEEVA